MSALGAEREGPPIEALDVVRVATARPEQATRVPVLVVLVANGTTALCHIGIGSLQLAALQQRSRLRNTAALHEPTAHLAHGQRSRRAPSPGPQQS